MFYVEIPKKPILHLYMFQVTTSYLYFHTSDLDRQRHRWSISFYFVIRPPMMITCCYSLSIFFLLLSVFLYTLTFLGEIVEHIISCPDFPIDYSIEIHPQCAKLCGIVVEDVVHQKTYIHSAKKTTIEGLVRVTKFIYLYV